MQSDASSVPLLAIGDKAALVVVDTPPQIYATLLHKVAFDGFNLSIMGARSLGHHYFSCYDSSNFLRLPEYP